MRHLFTILAVLALFCGAACGTTYYVSTSGSDSNPGTQTQPWATLQYAVDTIANGDTILVMPGTYIGCRIELAGASGAPKTIMAQTAGTVILNALGPINRHNRIFEIENYNAETNYWVVDGITVDGGDTIGGIDSRGTDTLRNHNITIQNCTAHNAANGDLLVTGIFTAHTYNALVQNNTSYDNSEHGIYTNNSADNGIVRSNVCYGNFGLGHHMNGDKSMGGDGIMSNWIVEKNKCFSNGQNGFDGDGVNYTIWRNNLSYDNVSKGIHLCVVNGATNPAYDKVYNNTLITQVGAYYPLTFFQTKKIKIGGNNNAAMNNILYNYAITDHMRGSIMYVTAWMSTFTSDYNVVVDRFGVDDNKNDYTLAEWRATFGKDMNSTLCLDADALFVDAAGKDFHLKSTSPAINAGTTLTDVTDDLEGQARPQGGGYDAGCYEDY